MKILDKKNGESIREYIVRLMKENIINLNFKPGQNISEKEIADELGISRTPVREAFIMLSHEELLEIYPQKGTYIALIDLDIVEEAKFLRITLEKVIARLACECVIEQNIIELEENIAMQEFAVNNKNSSRLLELDNAFHRIIFKACKKERIYSFMESINTHFTRVRMLKLTASINIDTVLSQHRDILSAIKEKNPEKAEKAMERHLVGLTVEQEILKQQFPHYFK